MSIRRRVTRIFTLIVVVLLAGLLVNQAASATVRTDETPDSSSSPKAKKSPKAKATKSPTSKATSTAPPESSESEDPSSAGGSTSHERVIKAKPYQGDPENEAALVADEDRRLTEIRTVDSLARWSKTSLNTPYRLATGSAYTLVLTQRKKAYTVKDLLALAPQTFLRQPDGWYLLQEHLVIQAGATLNLTASGGLKLRLASDPDGFVSIVNYGGTLNVQGAQGKPTRITSWDRESDSSDLLTDDGRAYVRSIGGQVLLRHAQLSDLGFWSGRTGGLSLTGTDRPNSGQLDKLGKTMDVGKRAKREREAEEAAKKKDEKDEPSLGNAGKSSLSEVLPTGDLPLDVDIADPEYSYVSASVLSTTIKGNAFGLFVASANGLEVKDSRFDNSLVDGLVMHRYVQNAVVESVSASGNAGDGFVLSRATTGIVLSEIQASRNHRNGLTMSGLPLADGPSATGSSLGSYGNNNVSNSTFEDNARYGVEVIGGQNVGVSANDLNGGDMGVVVRGGAKDVSVVGNRVSLPARQGIALRDGVSGAVVSGNIIDGGNTSVYLRDAAATVKRNTLTDATMHAVTLVGNVGSTEVTGNTISGRGPSAIDAKRAEDLNMRRWDNENSWNDTTPFFVTLKRFLQPLTAMWIILAALLLFTAARGARRVRRFVHPYADKAAVTNGIPHSVTQAEARL